VSYLSILPGTLPNDVLRVFSGPLESCIRIGGHITCAIWTHGQIELIRIPSRACTIASSRVIARTAP
jgi:hypothetical protein